MHGLKRRRTPGLFPVVLALIVQDEDFFAGSCQFEALPNLYFLFAGVILQSLNTRLLEGNFTTQLIILQLKFGHLMPFFKQALDAVRAAERHERIDNAAEDNRNVCCFAKRELHESEGETMVSPSCGKFP